MSSIFEDDKERAVVKDLAWKDFLAYTNPKLAIKQDDMAIRAYITQKLAPFDDYQFQDLDDEATRKYIREWFKA